MDAPFEDGLAGLLRVGQHRGVDMNHHLVPLARGAGFDPVVERRLREQGQRVACCCAFVGQSRDESAVVHGGMLGIIFEKAQNKIQDPTKLRQLIVELKARRTDRETLTYNRPDLWTTISNKQLQHVKRSLRR